ncbi:MULTISPECIES: DUF1995 family protein [Prochlorococcus]|uniref:DUF1995 domain-containing protein n=1 Tax=Prochlorococcus marinus (strain SARG / CCMP1375 / SS120) TaxID=167539 RepID=Q7VBZ2_PROMA|nr:MULTISPECIES: DUF1995 family protein [Prochlorococcus]AAP99994.1 Uncharacterized protein Pro_0950 [Prochlorococcus marinus subsp. marinus str. CCMP1375]KGG13792.1 hypothetical protein EV04_0277 [Prochlorococcus marinus str. LG]KGG18927.1 hypothetical protein EV08_1414 [Prochlorococcus marinus str. SS2]KGG23535.1 hypothetical protein EV09_1159 [Prochlorococcus marinus str. SS35]KGG32229.1 hypothetical protein EV10_1344 [Prochlorococcus marinus str. SS51]
MDNNNHQEILPENLSICEEVMQNSLLKYLLNPSNNRISIDLKFEGLKLDPIVFRLADKLNNNNLENLVVYSDFGGASLAKRDYPSYTSKIYATKELLNTTSKLDNSIIIAVSPQPFDYDEFERFSTSTNSTIVMINGRLEETSIGVGLVGRERRIKFIRSWEKVFWIEPLVRGALYREFPYDWSLFSYSNDGYRFCKKFPQRPEKDTINLELN